MPAVIAPLTDSQVRSAKPKARDYRLTDGQGLYLLISARGGQLWRFDYAYHGKRKTLALGD